MNLFIPGRTPVSCADIGCANITYEILAGNAERLFTLDPITGLVLTSGELDREIRDQYRLTGIVLSLLFA